MLVAVAFVLDVIFFTGFFGSDDASYAWAAHLLAHGNQIDPNELAHVRLALNLPSAVVYWLADGNIAWIAWAHVGYHLALVVLAYIIGVMLHSRPAGLVAAAIVAINPLFYVYAGAILPDNATALWLGLTIVFLELGRRQALGTLRAAGPLYFAAGLAIGVAYSCKETGLIMTIPAAICTISATGLRNWKWLRNGVIMAVGLALFFLIELIALRITGGEWSLRLTLLSTADGIYHKKMSWQGTGPLDRFDFAIERRLKPYVPHTWWILPAASVFYVFVRKRTVSLVTFFWWPALFLTIGSTSFTSYTAPSIQTRYYAIVVLPAAVMLGALAVQTHTWFVKSKYRPAKLPARSLAVLLVALATLIGLKEVRTNLPIAGNIYSSYRARALGLAIETAREKYPHLPIVLSPYFAKRLSPIFFPSAPGDIHADPRISEQTPPLPFVYLTATDRSNSGGITTLGVRNVQLGSEELVFPPRRRIDLVRNMWPRFFGVKPSRRYVRGPEGAVMIHVASQRDESEPNKGRRAPILAPLYRLERATHIQPTEGGFLVVSNAKKSSSQFFDSRTYKRSPRFTTSLLPAPTRRLEIAVTFTALAGVEGSVTASAFGYANGVVAKADNTSAIGPTPVELRLVLESDVAMSRFKLRFTRNAKDKSRAVTRVSYPTLRAGSRPPAPNEKPHGASPGQEPEPKQLDSARP